METRFSGNDLPEDRIRINGQAADLYDVDLNLDVECYDGEDEESLEMVVSNQPKASWAEEWIIPSFLGFLVKSGANLYFPSIPGVEFVLNLSPKPLVDTLSAIAGAKTIKIIQSLQHEDKLNLGGGLGMLTELAAAAFAGNTYRLALTYLGHTPEEGGVAIAASNAFVQTIGTVLVEEGLKVACPYLKLGFFAAKKSLSQMFSCEDGVENSIKRNPV